MGHVKWKRIHMALRHGHILQNHKPPLRLRMLFYLSPFWMVCKGATHARGRTLEHYCKGWHGNRSESGEVRCSSVLIQILSDDQWRHYVITRQIHRIGNTLWPLTGVLKLYWPIIDRLLTSKSESTPLACFSHAKHALQASSTTSKAY